MTEPTDDLEAVRIVAQALQGFDAKDQERIIRWAREKLGLVTSSTTPSRPTSEPTPPIEAGPLPPPAQPSIVRHPLAEASEVARPEVEQPVAEQPEVEAPSEAPLGAEQPGAVNILMPAPDQKHRASMVIAIILLVAAVAFLVVMIVSRGK